MTRALWWLATFVIGTAFFAVAWWLCEVVCGLDRGTSVTIATVAGPWLAAPAGWWATRDAVRSPDAGRSVYRGQARVPAPQRVAHHPQPAPHWYPAPHPPHPPRPRGTGGIVTLAMTSSIVVVAGGISAILWLSSRPAGAATSCLPDFGQYCLAEQSEPFATLVSSKTVGLIVVTVLVLVLVGGIWLSAWWTSLKRTRPPGQASWQDPRLVIAFLLIVVFVVFCCCCGYLL